MNTWVARASSPSASRAAGSAQWILMDYRDVIVHIFYAETRNFYSIDRVWADAPRLPLEPGRREKINLIKRPKRRMRLGGQTVETRI